MKEFQVIAIDVTNKPKEIPMSSWIVEGEIYTVIQVDKLTKDGNNYGFKLKEIDLDFYFPYIYFNANRFIPVDSLQVPNELSKVYLN